MKKEYLKPGAEYISFYSEEEIAGLDLQTWANNDGNGMDGSGVSNSWGETEKPEGWT